MRVWRIAERNEHPARAGVCDDGRQQLDLAYGRPRDGGVPFGRGDACIGGTEGAEGERTEQRYRPIIEVAIEFAAIEERDPCKIDPRDLDQTA